MKPKTGKSNTVKIYASADPLFCNELFLFWSSEIVSLQRFKIMYDCKVFLNWKKSVGESYVVQRSQEVIVLLE